MYANIYFDARKVNIHLWEYDEHGNRHKHVIPYEPYCYQLNKNGNYKGVVNGKSYSKLTFKNYNQQRNLCNDYKEDMSYLRDIPNPAKGDLYVRDKNNELRRRYEKDAISEGDITPQVRFLVDNYHGRDLLSKIPELHIHYIDIEVTSAKGFHQSINKTDEILLITT